MFASRLRAKPPAIPPIVSADSMMGKVLWLSNGVNRSSLKSDRRIVSCARRTDSAIKRSVKNRVVFDCMKRIEVIRKAAAAMTVKVIRSSRRIRWIILLKIRVPSMTRTAFTRKRAGSNSIPILLRKVAIKTLHPTMNPNLVRNIMLQATRILGHSFEEMFRILFIFDILPRLNAVNL